MTLRTVGLLSLLCLSLSACGGKGAKLATDPTVRKDEARVQAIVQTCAKRSHLSKKAFISCIAPPGQEVKVKVCASDAFAKDGVLTRRQRQRLEGDLTNCILKVKR